MILILIIFIKSSADKILQGFLRKQIESLIHAGQKGFYQAMIRLRHAHPTLHRKRVFECASGMYGHPPSTTGDALIHWHGVSLYQPDWGHASRSLAFTLSGVEGDAPFHVMMNAYWEELSFELPIAPDKGDWLRVVDTGLAAPHDLAEPGEEVPVRQRAYRVGPRSVVVLKSGTGG